MSLNHRIIAAAGLAVWISSATLVEARAPSQQKVAWTTLSQVKEAGSAVEFSREVAALDRTRVAIQGFRVPLEVKTHFLIAAQPSDCDHCIEGGPASYVEVFSKEPMKPTFGRPLTVAGNLELVRSSPSGSYYRLTDAELVSVD